MSAGPAFGDGRGGYPRVPHDWYVEEPYASERLFEVATFEGRVHDPCCGIGTIVRSARAAGYRATGSDIVDRGSGLPGVVVGVDFLRHRMHAVDNIVCNPPFDRDEDFVLRALAVARRAVAMFLRLGFLEGQTRFERLYQDQPPTRVMVFKRRIELRPNNRKLKSRGGQMAFQWLIWERGAERRPVEWI